MSDPYRPPQTEDSHNGPADWSGLRNDRLMVIAGFVGFFAVLLVPEGFGLFALIGAAMLFGLGVSLGTTFRCPVCEERFMSVKLGANALLGLSLLPYQAIWLLMRRSCQSCGTDVGSNGEG